MNIFYYIVGTILAIAPLIEGLVLKFWPPKKINNYYGFRTKVTASSQEAWVYAHKICANVLLIYSSIVILAYIIFLVINPPFLNNMLWILMIIGLIIAVVGVIISAIIVQTKTKDFISKSKNNSQ